MNETVLSKPLPLSAFHITDAFWRREMELVRNEVIPYQWEALNDRIPGAAPSWWMHNMRAAARRNAAKRAGKPWIPSAVAKELRFEPLPEVGQAPDPDAFYGFVFQDSDGYKWLEAVSYQLIRQPDPALKATAQEAVDAICAAQEDDGYLDTYYTLGLRERAFTNLRDHHELYCLGHLCEAAVAWHQATGQDDLLNAAIRFADCCAEKLGREPGKERGYPGHEIAEMALIRLWEETGEDRFLKQAEYFIDERGQKPFYFDIEDHARRGEALEGDGTGSAYHQANAPVRDQTEAQGHAVRAMYLYSGMADAARITGDPSLKDACEHLWHSAVEEKRYVTGGVGATHIGEAFSRPFDLPSDTAYSETCAAIGLAFFARRMLQLEPKSNYADVMEEALYNTVLSGMALDGKSFFYVNPLSCEPEACKTDARLGHVKPVRQKWFGCACCPPNIARIVSSLPQYAFTSSEDTLFVHLYVAGEMELTLNGKPLKLKIESSMPWNGEVSLSVAQGKAEGTIAVRIPGWSRDAKVSAVTLRNILTPGTPELAADEKKETEKDGYVYLTGTWEKGDRIEMFFDMPVRMLAADPRVRETAGQVCFMRGPVTYCTEAVDNQAPLHLWRVDPAALADKLDEIPVRDMEIGGVLVKSLEIPAYRVLQENGEGLYHDWHPRKEIPGTLTLIPYFVWDNRGETEMQVWQRCR